MVLPLHVSAARATCRDIEGNTYNAADFWMIFEPGEALAEVAIKRVCSLSVLTLVGQYEVDSLVHDVSSHPQNNIRRRGAETYLIYVSPLCRAQVQLSVQPPGDVFARQACSARVERRSSTIICCRSHR